MNEGISNFVARVPLMRPMATPERVASRMASAQGRPLWECRPRHSSAPMVDMCIAVRSMWPAIMQVVKPMPSHITRLVLPVTARMLKAVKNFFVNKPQKSMMARKKKQRYVLMKFRLNRIFLFIMLSPTSC